MTLKEIGNLMGVNYETIRYKEKKVYRFLRNPIRTKIIKPFILVNPSL